MKRARILLCIVFATSLLWTASSRAEFLYDWAHPTATSDDLGMVSDFTNVGLPLSQDIRAAMQPGIPEVAIEYMPAVYFATDRTSRTHFMRMDVKAQPTSASYAERYTIQVDSILNAGANVGTNANHFVPSGSGYTGIDFVIVTSWNASALSAPVLYVWNGAAFAASSLPFIEGVNYHYEEHYGSGNGFTLEWAVPFDLLGWGPFYVGAATMGPDSANTSYDVTNLIALPNSFVPEPSGGVLGALAFGGLAGILIRRRNGRK